MPGTICVGNPAHWFSAQSKAEAVAGARTFLSAPVFKDIERLNFCGRVSEENVAADKNVGQECRGGACCS